MTLTVMTTTHEHELARWNATAADYPADSCAHELFEEVASSSPDAAAASFGGRELSYRELDGRADRIAHRLRSLGVGPEQVVGICMEGSLDLPAAVLGVLKAGAAYLPLDPAYPQNRLGFMLSDAGAALVLTHERFAEKLSYLGVGRLLALDSAGERALLAAQPAGKPPPSATSRNAAYVIYTSGSTGRPKGVVIEHRSLVNLLLVLRRLLGLGPGRRVLQFASFSFDQSVQELFQALTSGATLCLARRE